MYKLKELLDRYVEKLISRKFLAWIIATYFCYTKTITSDDWVSITMGYIGVQAFIDMALQWKKNLPKQ